MPLPTWILRFVWVLSKKRGWQPFMPQVHWRHLQGLGLCALSRSDRVRSRRVPLPARILQQRRWGLPQVQGSVQSQHRAGERRVAGVPRAAGRGALGAVLQRRRLALPEPHAWRPEGPGVLAAHGPRGCHQLRLRRHLGVRHLHVCEDGPAGAAGGADVAVPAQHAGAGPAPRPPGQDGDDERRPGGRAPLQGHQLQRAVDRDLRAGAAQALPPGEHLHLHGCRRPARRGDCAREPAAAPRAIPCGPGGAPPDAGHVGHAPHARGPQGRRPQRRILADVARLDGLPFLPERPQGELLARRQRGHQQGLEPGPAGRRRRRRFRRDLRLRGPGAGAAGRGRQGEHGGAADAPEPRQGRGHQQRRLRLAHGAAALLQRRRDQASAQGRLLAGHVGQVPRHAGGHEV
mmetsp:Transcript_27219/g.84713  ORF Transcript_27219/g.84713 Transcript_27219/m.84713 type:complete len:403 (-) Transcript_27219:726-1934(-)